MTVSVTAAFAAFGQTTPAAGDAPSPSSHLSSTNSDLPSSLSDLRRFSLQAGVGLITQSSVDEIIRGRVHDAEGPAGGEIYLMQVSYKAARFHPEYRGHRAELDVELPLVLGIVNEHGFDAFPQYSAGFALRWKTFPWNKWLYTNLETGVGLTYSAHVLLTERERHHDDRSHLEFYWPVQIAFALPNHRQHQLVLFNHHHSGGWIFHTGGVNTMGLAYRYDFDQR